ncbi:MAG TPA: hypothetical protein VI320_39300 [Terracidiphilus sp.]|jgi:hypothetical protein
MDGVAATPHEIKNAIQATFASGIAEGHSRIKPQRTDTGDVGQIERLKLSIVWEVEKDGSRVRALCWYWLASRSVLPHVSKPSCRQRRTVFTLV